jgi:hypothetical protein
VRRPPALRRAICSTPPSAGEVDRRVVALVGGGRPIPHDDVSREGASPPDRVPRRALMEQRRPEAVSAPVTIAMLDRSSHSRDVGRGMRRLPAAGGPRPADRQHRTPRREIRQFCRRVPCRRARRFHRTDGPLRAALACWIVGPERHDEIGTCQLRRPIRRRRCRRSWHRMTTAELTADGGLSPSTGRRPRGSTGLWRAVDPSASPSGKPSRHSLRRGPLAACQAPASEPVPAALARDDGRIGARTSESGESPHRHLSHVSHQRSWWSRG